MLNEQRVSEKISTGGALREGDAPELKNRGFGAVINLLTPDEPGFQEREMVENAGMSYYSIPISLDLLDEDAVEKVCAAVDSSEGEVAVHCKGGGRAGILSLLYLAKKNGWDLETARREGEKLNVKIGADSIYAARFDELVRGFGEKNPRGVAP